MSNRLFASFALYIELPLRNSSGSLLEKYQKDALHTLRELTYNLKRFVSNEIFNTQAVLRDSDAPLRQAIFVGRLAHALMGASPFLSTMRCSRTAEKGSNFASNTPLDEALTSHTECRTSFDWTEVSLLA